MPTNRQPTLGVHLLETITRGMYSEPLHCVREYVQNAYDSIREARRVKILAPNEGVVRLILDQEAKILRIRDNGTGLSPEAAAVNLQDLGNSDKARSDKGSARNAGFRGIGRMAGISYCNTLRFETSDGNGKKCIVRFDATGINQLTRAGQTPTTIVDAIKQYSHISEQPEEHGQHYFEVILETLNTTSSFLDQEFLGTYLQQTAPVQYDPTEWSYGDKIQSLAQEVSSSQSLDHISIFICDADGNTQKDIRRPFKDIFETANARGQNLRTVQVKDIIPLPSDGHTANGWWGWLAVHERKGALADLPFAGLRIRMHNIQIGNEGIIRSLFKTSHLAMWCFGEIHLTDYTITPNAQRNDIEPSKAWSQIKSLLKEEADRIEKEIRLESSKRSQSKQNKPKQNKSKQSKSIPELLKEAEDLTKKAEKAITYKEQNIKSQVLDEKELKYGSSSGQQEISKVQDKIRNLAARIRPAQLTDDAVAHLSHDAREVISTVFGVLKSELGESLFSVVEKKINDALRLGNEK